MANDRTFYGYALDEIEEVAAEIFETVAEAHVPATMAILALCRAITLIGSESDLDLACLMIDQLRDVDLADLDDDNFTLEEDEANDES